MKHKYRNLADMEDDMMPLCQNARKFNEEGSQIYTDSLELENAYLESRAQMTLSTVWMRSLLLETAKAPLYMWWR